MSNKKGKIMSFALEPEFEAVLKNYAVKKQVSASAVVRELIQRSLTTEGETTKIILSLPNEVLANPEMLKQWLLQKTGAIIHHFKNGSP